VAITGRDAGRAEAAATEIRGQNADIDVFIADMSSLQEVRRLAAELAAQYTRINVLVNNVGGYWNHRQVTVDGLERTFALNHLAPFLLTNLLLERLIAGAPARVVTVSSNAQAMGRIDFDDLQGARSYSGARAYNQSKLANLLFSYELARRLAGRGVTANALHPGVVRTGFGSEDPGRLQKLVMPVGRLLLKSPEKGAETSIHLASSPDVEGVTGRFFVNCKRKKSAPQSYDRDDALRLWEVSAELVGGI
jgi:retinol dehydrogenase-14